jgi:hypothetical protein
MHLDLKSHRSVVGAGLAPPGVTFNHAVSAKHRFPNYAAQMCPSFTSAHAVGLLTDGGAA